MPFYPTGLLPHLIFGLVAYFALASASLQMQGANDAMAFFEKINRLNYHYYLHDDANYTRSGKDGCIVRLGRAHYWKYNQCY